MSTEVEQWVFATRREQGLPERVEELEVLVDLAKLVIERSGGDPDGTTG
jgi:hypothetical protein